MKKETLEKAKELEMEIFRIKEILSWNDFHCDRKNKSDFTECKDFVREETNLLIFRVESKYQKLLKQLEKELENLKD